MFQARHFEFMAETLRGLAITPKAHKETVSRFADKLGSTNPKFDRARFVAACQPKAA